MKLVRALCVLLPLLAAAPAGAQDCAALPNPLFVPGTTDVKPFLARVAPKLAAASGADQLTVVYQPMGSCTALAYVLDGTPLQGSATYWAQAGDGGTPEERSCAIPAGTRASLALSDVTVRTCTGEAPDAGIGEFPSMVQPFGFVVPLSSQERAIAAEEAYFLLKFGGQAGYQVPPWTDPASIAVRTPAASTQLLIGLAAGVPGTRWSSNLTNTNSGSSAVVSKVAAENTTGNADKTLGILSTQRYDENRDKLRMLAFQAFGQGCLGAVYPDSSANAFDKQNVRDGHYAIWGYLWGVALVDAQGRATGAARQFVEFLNGDRVVNEADPVADAARAGAVPACAMQVKRGYDGAPLEPYEPGAPCGCFYESVATGSSSCASCPAGTCASGTCRRGFCEAK